jgi:outer membrane protein
MGINHPRLARTAGAAGLLALAAVLGAPAAQAQQTPAVTVAVIDVGRILEESKAGKALLAELKALQDQKYSEAQVQQNQMKDIQDQINKGKLSLSQEKLADLQNDLERRTIALKRLEDDSNRELNQLRQDRLEKIEARVMPIINQVGQEFGYTMIFNKFQSGLVYAKEDIDITDLILKRFDAASTD